MTGDRRPVRIRRRGRHGSPSQVEKVAQQAGKAAPAVAIAGATLVAAPQLQHAFAAAGPVPVSADTHHTAAAPTDAGTGTRAAPATLDTVRTQAVVVVAARPARHAAPASGTHYRVRSGDTLSEIAGRYYGNPGDWQYLYHENAKTISNPDVIYVGESIFVPAAAPANSALTGYVPRHAKPAPAPAVHVASKNSSTQVTSRPAGGTADVVAQSAPQGHYSCSALEGLWEQAGGTPAHAFMAAEIAMAESGGNPNAISPTDDFGLWQINGSNGALATLNPVQNAKSAIALSADGTNWGPWTTYHSGAYSGRC
jgi:LysM repeat protein